MNRLPLIRRAVWVRRRAGLPPVRLDGPGESSRRVAPALRARTEPARRRAA